MRGYKLLNADYTGEDCESKVTFNVGEIYETKGDLELYNKGFHFKDRITKLGYEDGLKVVEVEILGKIKSGLGAKCTNKISIVRELSKQEIIDAHNVGSNCKGLYNVGSCNDGDYNVGGYNQGNSNVGDFNQGDFNIFDYNEGSFNVGSHNKGSYNVGDWNVGNGCCGAFNTEAPRMKFFNEWSLWTIYDWYRSDARGILLSMPNDGSCRQEWWDNLSADDKDIVKLIPNFDSTIFKSCTGIQVKER